MHLVGSRVFSIALMNGLRIDEQCTVIAVSYTHLSVMITPENVMMRTRFLVAMGMFYFRIIERRGRPQESV